MSENKGKIKISYMNVSKNGADKKGDPTYSKNRTSKRPRFLREVKK